MKILESKVLPLGNAASVRFIRIDPEDLTETLSDILKTIMDLSWLKDFDKEFLAQSFEECAKITISDIKSKFDAFDGGERFEPDYLLFLHAPKNEGYEQLQVFIEPKGTHLVETDKWKEEFLLEIENKAVPRKVFVDDNYYKIWGFHFFNKGLRDRQFDDDMKKLM